MKYLIIFAMILTACGKDGRSGINGNNGMNGINGVDGKDATPVSMIKFCPSLNEVYPTNFPEYGMCVNNNLYAVYWNGNTAFLSKLLPGTYTTTAIGGNCTFTVQSNSCTVL
jgi:hypothetical protein